jgi:hypothetical protein
MCQRAPETLFYQSDKYLHSMDGAPKYYFG